MKKTSYFHWMLMAAMVCGFSLTFTACSDDDDETKTEEQKQQETEKANIDANTFWGVVGQLAGITNYEEDYKGKQYEASIGVEDESNALQRIVAVNSLAAAVQSFNDLTGAKITESTGSFEWKSDAVGTLVWTKGDSRDYGTVDVTIPQMKNLQRIIYRNSEQMGTNGKFQGAAYYRFGDVVSKRRADGVEEKWICVRPCFGPEGKQTSHWACIEQLPEKNIKKKGENWYVPTGLGVNKEHMRNLAELIYAMLYPNQWAANLQNDPKLTVFHDFEHKNLMYHTAAYWQEVAKNWDAKSMFGIIFGYQTNEEAKNALRKAIAEDGLNFLYNGYEWSWFGDECTLFQANYSGANLKTETLTEKEVDVAQIRLDFRTRNNALVTTVASFFGDDPAKPQPRWCVRFATGKELSGAKENEKTQLKGCESIVRYYNDANTLTNLEIKRQKDEPVVGDIMGRNGKFYGIGQDAIDDGTTPIAIVIFRGANADNFRPEANGLAWAIEDATSDLGVGDNKVMWATEKFLQAKDNSSTIAVKQVNTVEDIINNWKQDMGGSTAFRCFVLDDVSEMGPWINNTFNLDKRRSVISNDHMTSSWFVPTASQLAYSLTQIAQHPEWANSEYYGQSRLFLENNGTKLKADFYDKLLGELYLRLSVDGKAKMPSGQYWLATQMNIENNWEMAWYYNISDKGLMLNTDRKTDSKLVRPIVAFAAQ